MSSYTPLVIIVAAAIGGGLLAAQGPIFARMAIHAGGALQAGMIAFGLGFLALMVLYVVTGGTLPRLDHLKAAPGWVWFGGVIGAAMVLLSIVAVPRIGVGTFMAAVLCGQLFAAIFYDHVGAFGLPTNAIDTSKIIGAGLLLAGAYLIIHD